MIWGRDSRDHRYQELPLNAKYYRFGKIVLMAWRVMQSAVDDESSAKESRMKHDSTAIDL